MADTCSKLNVTAANLLKPRPDNILNEHEGRLFLCILHGPCGTINRSEIMFVRFREIWHGFDAATPHSSNAMVKDIVREIEEPIIEKQLDLLGRSTESERSKSERVKFPEQLFRIATGSVAVDQLERQTGVRHCLSINDGSFLFSEATLKCVHVRHVKNVCMEDTCVSDAR